MLFVLIVALFGSCFAYHQNAGILLVFNFNVVNNNICFPGHYYDLQPVRRHFNLQVPEPIANAHPHDEAATVQQHPLYGTYAWKYPNSEKSNNPNRKGIDYVFGLQRWAKIPK